MRKIKQVKAMDGYRLDVTFDDGTRGVADVSDLAGRGVFAIWNDRAAFERVEIGSSGELVWNGEIDLCPDALYLRVTGRKAEDVFPLLKKELAHA
jgi:hypothetical protein